MKLYYMRDNHTFLKLPPDASEADRLIRAEFAKGWTYGTLFARNEDDTSDGCLHASGEKDADSFFDQARDFISERVGREA